VIAHNYKYFCKEQDIIPYQRLVEAFSHVNEETALLMWRFINVFLEKAETP